MSFAPGGARMARSDYANITNAIVALADAATASELTVQLVGGTGHPALQRLPGSEDDRKLAYGVVDVSAYLREHSWDWERMNDEAYVNSDDAAARVVQGVEYDEDSMDAFVRGTHNAFSMGLLGSVSVVAVMVDLGTGDMVLTQTPEAYLKRDNRDDPFKIYQPASLVNILGTFADSVDMNATTFGALGVGIPDPTGTKTITSDEARRFRLRQAGRPALRPEPVSTDAVEANIARLLGSVRDTWDFADPDVIAMVRVLLFAPNAPDIPSHLRGQRLPWLIAALLDMIRAGAAALDEALAAPGNRNMTAPARLLALATRYAASGATDLPRLLRGRIFRVDQVGRAVLGDLTAIEAALAQPGMEAADLDWIVHTASLAHDMDIMRGMLRSPHLDDRRGHWLMFLLYTDRQYDMYRRLMIELCTGRVRKSAGPPATVSTFMLRMFASVCLEHTPDNQDDIQRAGQLYYDVLVGGYRDGASDAEPPQSLGLEWADQAEAYLASAHQMMSARVAPVPFLMRLFKFFYRLPTEATFAAVDRLHIYVPCSDGFVLEFATAFKAAFLPTIDRPDAPGRHETIDEATRATLGRVRNVDFQQMREESNMSVDIDPRPTEDVLEYTGIYTQGRRSLPAIGITGHVDRYGLQGRRLYALFWLQAYMDDASVRPLDFGPADIALLRSMAAVYARHRAARADKLPVLDDPLDQIHRQLNLPAVGSHVDQNDTVVQQEWTSGRHNQETADVAALTMAKQIRMEAQVRPATTTADALPTDAALVGLVQLGPAVDDFMQYGYRSDAARGVGRLTATEPRGLFAMFPPSRGTVPERPGHEYARILAELKLRLSVRVAGDAETDGLEHMPDGLAASVPALDMYSAAVYEPLVRVRGTAKTKEELIAGTVEALQAETDGVPLLDAVAVEPVTEFLDRMSAADPPLIDTAEHANQATDAFDSTMDLAASNLDLRSYRVVSHMWRTNAINRVLAAAATPEGVLTVAAIEGLAAPVSPLGEITGPPSREEVRRLVLSLVEYRRHPEYIQAALCLLDAEPTESRLLFADYMAILAAVAAPSAHQRPNNDEWRRRVAADFLVETPFMDEAYRRTVDAISGSGRSSRRGDRADPVIFSLMVTYDAADHRDIHYLLQHHPRTRTLAQNERGRDVDYTIIDSNALAAAGGNVFLSELAGTFGRATRGMPRITDDTMRVIGSSPGMAHYVLADVAHLVVPAPTGLWALCQNFAAANEARASVLWLLQHSMTWNRGNFVALLGAAIASDSLEYVERLLQFARARNEVTGARYTGSRLDRGTRSDPTYRPGQDDEDEDDMDVDEDEDATADQPTPEWGRGREAAGIMASLQTHGSLDMVDLLRRYQWYPPASTAEYNTRAMLLKHVSLYMAAGMMPGPGESAPAAHARNTDHLRRILSWHEAGTQQLGLAEVSGALIQGLLAIPATPAEKALLPALLPRMTRRAEDAVERFPLAV